MKQSKRQFAAILGACLTALGAAGCSPQSQEAAASQPQELVIPVEYALPRLGDLEVKNEFIGRIMPEQSVSIYPKLGGEVIAAPFEVGDTVNAGDLLLQVDGTSIQMQVNQAYASYQSAQVAASQGLGTGYDAQLIQAEAAVNSAAAQYNQMKNKLDEYEDMVGGKPHGYDPQYRDLRAAKSAAADAYSAAKASLELLQNGAYDDAVKSADAQVAVAAAAYRAAAQSLDNTRLYAPISGVIEAKNYDVHETASQQAPAYVISNKDIMTVTYSVPADAVPAMEIGDMVELECGSKTYTGAIVEVGTIASEQSGLFPVKARIEGDITGLLSGTSAKVTASTKKTEGAMLIPVDSVYHEGGQAYVYLVSGQGTVEKTPVETGITDDVVVEILSGLSLEDKVISTWNPNLADGVKVSLPGQAEAVSTKPQAEESRAEEPEESSQAEGAQTEDVQAEDAQAENPRRAASGQQSQAASQAEEPEHASQRGSLITQAYDQGEIPPTVPDEIHPGDEADGSEVE